MAERDIRPIHRSVCEDYNSRHRKKIKPETARAVADSVKYGLPVDGLAKALKVTTEVVEEIVKTQQRLEKETG